jgi:hypothetical protein
MRHVRRCFTVSAASLATAHQNNRETANQEDLHQGLATDECSEEHEQNAKQQSIICVKTAQDRKKNTVARAREPTG